MTARTWETRIPPCARWGGADVLATDDSDCDCCMCRVRRFDKMKSGPAKERARQEFTPQGKACEPVGGSKNKCGCMA